MSSKFSWFTKLFDILTTQLLKIKTHCKLSKAHVTIVKKSSP